MIATFSTRYFIAASLRGSNLISITFMTWGLIAATSSDLEVDFEATPILSENVHRFGLMKLSIPWLLRGSEKIS